MFPLTCGIQTKVLFSCDQPKGCDVSSELLLDPYSCDARDGRNSRMLLLMIIIHHAEYGVRSYYGVHIQSLPVVSRPFQTCPVMMSFVAGEMSSSRVAR